MVFNSVVFLFCFLPLALLVYYLVPGKGKNAVLLLESLIFYCWTGITWLPLIAVLIAVNYLAGLFLGRRKGGGRKLVLVLAVVVSAAALIFFKYTNFLIDTLNQIAGLGLSSLSFLSVLPLGISYYIFKLISYVSDVYTRKTEPEKNLIDFSAYVLFFPQLIVGPIVRYRDMAQTLHTGKGRCTLQKAEDGAIQFVFGLAKKVILADSIGMLWQDIIAPDGGVGLANASTPLAWLGILAYSLQLYFDFAGYSEMSNGLSRMMGFECPANFNLPYMATSITDFWRRWHISLSMWFRDYVYIPLGGNRCSKGRQILNMLVVWALTGFWHGANWNFLCWGLYYFVLLVIEKYLLRGVLQKGRGWQRVYTLFFVVLGWGIFTANAAGAPLGLLMSRLFLPQGGVSPLYFLRNYGVLLLLGCLFSTSLPGWLWEKTRRILPLRLLLFAGVMLLSIAFVVASTGSTALYADF
ncbi:MBOAT family protein [uncultured Subdoligranulum sp.]|uniref:MBOAT family O-acyltransferase n=1 Tax=uncultured Subdoligranulum sp. TaxID=512298 RepID=UPI0025DD193C|nr:MBOAT family O-acyltransferase [uncultured Subdoligranulum sp.]